MLGLVSFINYENLQVLRVYEGQGLQVWSKSVRNVVWVFAVYS